MDRPKFIPPTGQEGEGIGNQLLAPTERMKDVRRTVEGMLDPFGIVSPILHANSAWLLHPQEFADLCARFASDLTVLMQNTAAKLTDKGVGDVVQPQPDDRRFSDPVWTNDPNYSLLKQWYLFYTRHIQDALFETPGLAPKERRRAAFWWRNWLNAMAPTNFLATNPVAQRKAIETNGESLRRGYKIFMDDVRAKTVRMAEAGDFKVGVNLATTPGAVVFRNRLLELIHYKATAKKVHAMPIVIVVPWINKYYVLDLDEKKSMVRYLLEQGYDVYITSWKNPDASMRETTFGDYVIDGVDAAVRVAREISGAEKVGAVGYCIGGTLLSVYMAWLNRRYTREELPVAHWTLFTTLTDFQSPGDIEVFIDEGAVRFLVDSMRTKGYLDGSEMALTFRLLRANALIWHYVEHGWLYGEQPPTHDVLFWNMDTTRMPARMHEYYLTEMYLNNKLIKSNALTIAGEAIDLTLIHAPLYQVSAEDDHVAPWRQTFRISNYVTGAKRFVLSSSGHILGIVNPPVDPPHRTYRTAPAHRGETAEAWLATAAEHSGSWWEDWVVWLGERSGELKDPPPLANLEYPELADAPGTYVLEH
jgi:polyhydroxyalkanoate synthase